MASNADMELLTEHFGYPPVSLLDDIINSVNILTERALSGVESALLRQPPASLGFKAANYQPKDGAKLSPEELEAAAEAAHRHEVENGTHQLETLLYASIDRNFDKFEIYAMRNILCVKPDERDWMRLAHYEGLEFDDDDNTGNGDDDGDASIAHLHRRLQASLKLGHLLDVEGQRNETMLEGLRAAVGQKSKTPDASNASDTSNASLAFLLDRGPLTEGGAAAPLTTTTAFALSQLPALRQLSGELQTRAPALAAAAAADAADSDTFGDATAGDGARDGKGSKSWRRERLEYIESSTRKHLERMRGLSLGQNGETPMELEGPLQNNGADSSGGSGPGSMAVEPEALKNILSILRDSHGPTPAGEGDSAQDAMDES